VAEATALATEAVVGEAGDAASRRESVERQLTEHFEPLARAAEQMLDGIAAELSARETFGITHTELKEIR
jgi:hypothetical protein